MAHRIGQESAPKESFVSYRDAVALDEIYLNALIKAQKVEKRKENINKLRQYDAVRCEALAQRLTESTKRAACRRQGVMEDRARRAAAENRIAFVAQNKRRMDELTARQREQVINALSIREKAVEENQFLLRNNWLVGQRDTSSKTVLARACRDAMSERRSMITVSRIQEAGDRTERVIEHRMTCAEEKRRKNEVRFEHLRAAHIRNETIRRRREEQVASRFEDAKEIGNIICAFNRQYGAQH